ncbi:hypothetical protein [Paenibacillus sp. FSL R10-2788]|uniref:hypothetical protein n=1 Tax=Paenibacillus sp. FSL R10-2788 TaxID=2954694 RepID=UPI0030F597FC
MAAEVPSNFGDLVWSTVADTNPLAIVYLSSNHRVPIVSYRIPIVSYRTQLTLYADF